MFGLFGRYEVTVRNPDFMTALLQFSLNAALVSLNFLLSSLCEALLSTKGVAVFLFAGEVKILEESVVVDGRVDLQVPHIAHVLL